MNKKIMGMGKLSQFSGIQETKKKPPQSKQQEELVTVNIKIRKTQKEWLADTAAQVRENNVDPVPPNQRVYPQHLIGVALDLLAHAEVDWSQVKNIKELREQLNL